MTRTTTRTTGAALPKNHPAKNENLTEVLPLLLALLSLAFAELPPPSLPMRIRCSRIFK